MKSFATIILICIIGTMDTFAQGSIRFSNRIPGILDAPVFDVDCTTPLAGTAFVAQGYYGTTPDVLQPLGAPYPFRDGAGAGYLNASLVVFSVEGYEPVFFQLRAWELAAGGTFEKAAASGGKFGFSNIFVVEPAWGPDQPTPLIGLESFCLIPEPTPILLLGLGSLLLLSRTSKGKQRSRC